MNILDEDYKYADLLRRLKHLQHPNGEDEESVEAKRKLPAIMLAKIGTKKTMFATFPQTCDQMQRDIQHVMSYFLAELACDGSLDSQNRLVLKRRCLPQEIEGVLRKYVESYVQCRTCKKPDTVLTRDSTTRLQFLECSRCHSKTSVAPIQKGFHATTKTDRKMAKQIL
jgi:translation initiation factor 2 subunit 2